MKTNVTMQSTDRNLFGVIIRQNTKDGQSLSISDLQKAYEIARFQYGWKDRRINDIMSGKDFQERCYHLLKERDLIKAGISAFMEMIDNEGVVKVLKGLGVWKTSGRGENKSVYSDPYIWVLLAMELNPLMGMRTTNLILIVPDFDIALDLLEIKISDLRGELYDLLHEVVLNQGNTQKKPENILILFYEELVSYVEKYIKADKAYS